MRTLLAAMLFSVVLLVGNQTLGEDAPDQAPIRIQRPSVVLIFGELILPDTSSVFFTLQENMMFLKLTQTDNGEVSRLTFAPTLSNRTEGSETLLWHTPLTDQPRAIAAHSLSETQMFVFNGKTYQIKVSGIKRDPFSPDERTGKLPTLPMAGVSYSASGELSRCEKGKDWIVCADVVSPSGF